MLRHYGVPAKRVQFVSMLNSHVISQLIYNTELIDIFNISTGVK
jgi:hypothetical protein